MRRPETVMAPHRVGARFPDIMSFSRTLVRRLQEEDWSICPTWRDLDRMGRGEALYQIDVAGRRFHFFVISDQVPAEEKSDRVIAKRWDATASLFEGEATARRLTQMRTELPRQKTGRADADTLAWTRANRSERLFEHVVAALADGRQPDGDRLCRVGYVMRTTAFYGNGKLGTRPFASFEPDHPLGRTYDAQILTAFMLREFVFDLVEEMARWRSPNAVRLVPALKRYLGIGNSAGLGLVPFLVTHPRIVHTWTEARERALSQVRRLPAADVAGPMRTCRRTLRKADQYFRESSADGKGYFASSYELTDAAAQLGELAGEYLDVGTVDGQAVERPLDAMYRWATERCGVESQELLVAVLLDSCPDIARANEHLSFVDEDMDFAPARTTGNLRTAIDETYAWALSEDDRFGETDHYFWYRSREAGEPRIGVRGMDAGDDCALPIDVVPQIRRLVALLEDCGPSTSLARFAHENPSFRYLATRILSLAEHPFSEVQDDFTAEGHVPLYPLRFLLAIYGLEKFDPRSIKWVRGTILQGAPTARDVASGVDGDWPFPLIPRDLSADEGAAAVDSPELAPTSERHVARPSNDRPAGNSTHFRLALPEVEQLCENALRSVGVELGFATEIARLYAWAECVGLHGLETLEAELNGRRFASVTRISRHNAAGSDACRLGGRTLSQTLVGLVLCDLLEAARVERRSGVQGSADAAQEPLEAILIARHAAARGRTAWVISSGRGHRSEPADVRCALGFPGESRLSVMAGPIRKVAEYWDMACGASRPPGITAEDLVAYATEGDGRTILRLLDDGPATERALRFGSEVSVWAEEFDSDGSDKWTFITAEQDRRARLGALRYGLWIDGQTHQTLAAFAERMLVPASENSREGAGE